MVEVVTKNRHLFHDILSHTRHLSEEEEGEESSHAAEAGCETAAEN
jgi:hypothetical protein